MKSGRSRRTKRENTRRWVKTIESDWVAIMNDTMFHHRGIFPSKHRRREATRKSISRSKPEGK